MEEILSVLTSELISKPFKMPCATSSCRNIYGYHLGQIALNAAVAAATDIAIATIAAVSAVVNLKVANLVVLAAATAAAAAATAAAARVWSITSLLKRT